MKKLVFATQVFGVIAMFPFVMFLELNRSNVSSAEGISRSITKQRIEMINIHLPGKEIDKLEKDVFPATVETILLQAFKK